MFYKFCRNLCKAVFFLLYRLEAKGRENVPDQGAVILCSNHFSNLDPITVGVSMRRHLSYMAKEELFRVPVLSTIIRNVGAFPVKRGGISKTSFRTTLDVLKSGKILCVFPEGTRRGGSGKKGAASFALKSEAVVIPVAIVGNYTPFRKMKVIYGKPVTFDDIPEQSGDKLQLAADRIMQEIRNLIPGHRS